MQLTLTRVDIKDGTLICPVAVARLGRESVIFRIRPTGDSETECRLDRWLAEFKGVEVARLLAAVRQAGRPRGAHDLLIAATALASNGVVITADESDFDDLPGVTFETHRSSQ